MLGRSGGVWGGFYKLVYLSAYGNVPHVALGTGFCRLGFPRSADACGKCTDISTKASFRNQQKWKKRVLCGLGCLIKPVFWRIYTLGAENSKMEKKELQKRASGSQTQAKNTQKRAQRSQKGAKMEPMGAKSEPKRSQRVRKGSQRVPKGNPKGAKGSQKGAKERPKWIQKSPWAPGSILGAKMVLAWDRFWVNLGPFFDQKVN